MLRVAAYGRVGNDPVTRTIRSGNTMVTASLAVSVSRAGEDELIEWMSLASFGRLANELNRHRKGDLVGVMGELHRTSYTTRDGETRTGWSLTVESLLSARTVRPGGRRQKQAPPQKTPRSSSRSGSGPAAGQLPDDRVDDLWGNAP